MARSVRLVWILGDSLRYPATTCMNKQVPYTGTTRSRKMRQPAGWGGSGGSHGPQTGRRMVGNVAKAVKLNDTLRLQNSSDVSKASPVYAFKKSLRVKFF